MSDPTQPARYDKNQLIDDIALGHRPRTTYLPLGLPAEIRAIARALWAVRVLDAVEAGRAGKGEPQWLLTGKQLVYGWDESRDAARLAAAEAVYPTLPADVRATLGVQP